MDAEDLTVEPPAISMPPEAPEEVRAVFDAYLLVREVYRMVVPEAEEIPFSYGFVAERCRGLAREDAVDPVRWLVAEGYLLEGKPLPPTKGRAHGTNTYRLGSRR